MKNNRQIKDALYEQVARISKALASPKRLELIEVLSQSPKTVDELAQAVGISMKLASAHLKELKMARLVLSERSGKNVSYRLADSSVAQIWINLRMVAEDRLFELQQVLQQMAVSGHEWRANDRSELLEKAQNGDIVVLDVRPNDEFAQAHLPFANSIPLDELNERLKELPRDKTIVAYCRGPFCLMAPDAVKLLRQHGFNALHLRDGVLEWQREQVI